MSSQTRLNQLEREYFIRKLGGTILPQRPMNDIKREYFISQIAVTSPSESTITLERKWLRDLITTGGGTPSSTENELWSEAVLVEGGTPTKFPNQNKRIFYEIAS